MKLEIGFNPFPVPSEDTGIEDADVEDTDIADTDIEETNIEDTDIGDTNIVRTEDVGDFVSMILTVIATSRLRIGNVSILARETYWEDHREFLSDSHEVFPQVDFGALMARVHNILRPIAGAPINECLAQALIVLYDAGSSVTYDYVEQCLYVGSIATRFWDELRDWLELVECLNISIYECGIDLDALQDLLSDTHENGYSLRALTIVNTTIFYGSAIDDDLLAKAGPRSLISAISSFAHKLEYIHLANIDCHDEDLQWPAYKGCKGLIFKKKDEMQGFLSALHDGLPEEDESAFQAQASAVESLEDEDEDSNYSDTEARRSDIADFSHDNGML
ncbi:hypothetical protein E4T43_02976 [Aureobasidium subglaciale]|nr:hypothetical protein E4T43_02976 [Aureobasidium subglaciale]